ncbi:TPA: hypothetical protein N0F65_012269 [Lagenidium giganteum]|uniref:Uncharacterized protein n=1 Tax=Lagenidium giganteum TaxID=4803 RepID=A0AAV2ZEP8_9STRA|nr:TPA: hypothetical protein N0F65_012269 [Lagenidium giganteum]
MPRSLKEHKSVFQRVQHSRKCQRLDRMRKDDNEQEQADSGTATITVSLNRSSDLRLAFDDAELGLPRHNMLGQGIFESFVLHDMPSDGRLQSRQ